MQDKVLIGIFAGGFGVCICGVLCFLTLEKICGWGVVPNHSDQREEPRVITRNPVVQDTVPASQRFFSQQVRFAGIMNNIVDRETGEIISQSASITGSVTHSMNNV